MITITITELRAYVTKRLADGTPIRQKRSRVKDEASASDAPKRPVSAGEINRELPESIGERLEQRIEQPPRRSSGTNVANELRDDKIAGTVRSVGSLCVLGGCDLVGI